MANIRKADPFFTHVPSLRHDINRLFEGILPPQPTTDDRSWAPPWVPALDVAETDAAFTVTAELPGLKPDEVEINLTGNVLTLRGEKKEESEEKGKNWHRVERSYGGFLRTVQLPDIIDAERTKASFENGVLTVEIGKKEISKPRTIKVQVTK